MECGVEVWLVVSGEEERDSGTSALAEGHGFACAADHVPVVVGVNVVVAAGDGVVGAHDEDDRLGVAEAGVDAELAWEGWEWLELGCCTVRGRRRGGGGGGGVFLLHGSVAAVWMSLKVRKLRQWCCR